MRIRHTRVGPGVSPADLLGPGELSEEGAPPSSPVAAVPSAPPPPPQTSLRSVRIRVQYLTVNGLVFHDGHQHAHSIKPVIARAPTPAVASSAK